MQTNTTEIRFCIFIFTINVSKAWTNRPSKMNNPPPKKSTTGIIYCWVLMPLCTTPDTTSQWRCTVHPDTNRESLRYVTVILSTTHFQLYTNIVQSDREIQKRSSIAVYIHILLLPLAAVTPQGFQ